ncbi:hypothetical protein [Asticcacaulis sp.]|uniref:hypothetical protein n=1 Tax=Asticcacaulis sp. TaxID=1872648 RepID=UPI002630D622|nr:hypothetical protein [Asticcacaulis sp.]
MSKADLTANPQDENREAGHPQKPHELGGITRCSDAAVFQRVRMCVYGAFIGVSVGVLAICS